MTRDEIIMCLSEIAEQPTQDGIVDGISQQTIREALELLNEQEITVQPERRYLSIDPHLDKYICSRRGDLGLHYRQRFCGGCGKEVRWNAQQ